VNRSKQFATFHLAGLFLGVDVLKVQEVIRYQEMTRVPIAPPMVEGLINLRGQIITAIDLRRRLGLADRADGELPMNVVIRSDDGAASVERLPLDLQGGRDAYLAGVDATNPDVVYVRSSLGVHQSL
jgi:chemotaxis signal transduction protein